MDLFSFVLLRKLVCGSTLGSLLITNKNDTEQSDAETQVKNQIKCFKINPLVFQNNDIIVSLTITSIAIVNSLLFIEQSLLNSIYGQIFK